MDSNTVRNKYSKLAELLVECNQLRGVKTVLDWDQQVMMPSKASDIRGKQLALIAGILHDKGTSPEIGKLLDELEDSSNASSVSTTLDKWELANLRDARRNYDRTTKISKDLAQREALLSNKGYTVWVEAKQSNDFAKFAPIIKEWISLRKEMAQCIDPTKDPYDVLLEDYERGLTSARIETVFTQVRDGLVPLLQRIRSNPINVTPLTGPFPISVQTEVNQKIAKALGFDMESGRLDVSAHPMTIEIHPLDVRMTTRYKEDDLFEGITGTVHETGHALYEQGRNIEHADLPVSCALSMGIHESQSLTWERMVGLSLPFWQFFTPLLLQSFPTLSNTLSPQDLYKAINAVKFGLIRVEADEVTYPMHIILRYELERGLMAGTIQVEELPKLWNEKMKSYLGVEVPSDSVGVMQDVHWSIGLFGYFPTYLLGAIYASQFYRKAEAELENLQDNIKNGDFTKLREWLKEKIHQKGSLIPSGDKLTEEVTGEPLNPKLFLDHLTNKYTDLYK